MHFNMLFILKTNSGNGLGHWVSHIIEHQMHYWSVLFVAQLWYG